MCLKGCQEHVSQRLNGQEPAGEKLSRRGFLKTAAAATAALAAGAPALPALGAPERQAPPQFPFRRVVDLTHTFRAGFPVYAFDNPTRSTRVTIESDGFYSQDWTFNEHSGTHMDAPGHFITGGRGAAQIAAEELIRPLVVVDISHKAAVNPDAQLTLEEVEAWEKRHGRIPRGSCVAMYSGWEKYVDDQAAFRGEAPDGFHFPGFRIDAVDFLLEERDIGSIAVDTMSLDYGQSATFDVHFRLLGSDRWGLENVANLANMPARGGFIVAAVIPWEKGSGGPARVLGLAH